ncbi:unnamed protein product [Adineta ricciae]|uniref:Uncharacterized protein n=1 Tax=Adineta ricciae TaxID=249248 RepID=A0A815NI98_ADIRI|nr:unnamed protein product [Adineta ricciae]
MTVLDAYRTFNEQHPGLVARSTFNALRPREAWNNHYQKCAGIGALSATNKINMKDLINQMVCPGSNEKCFSGKCNNCSSKNDSFVVAQIDFSMNYTLIRLEGEVQQGFFSQHQVSLFTIHLTIGDEHTNLAIISKYMEHTTAFVHCAQKILVEFIKENFPLVKKINYVR